MFGLSLTKIVLLIVVIGAVVFGARLLRTLGSSKPAAPDRPEPPAQQGEATTFTACPRCGAYVDPVRHHCGPDAGRSGG